MLETKVVPYYIYCTVPVAPFHRRPPLLCGATGPEKVAAHKKKIIIDKGYEKLSSNVVLPLSWQTGDDRSPASFCPYRCICCGQQSS